MRSLLVLVAALAVALPATAAPANKLRVDRPQKGAGARVTAVRVVAGGTVGHRTRAIVLTDTRCDPDARGVSHCLNKMKLASGRIVVVVHDHRMMEMPCLSPGERVVLTPV